MTQDQPTAPNAEAASLQSEARLCRALVAANEHMAKTSTALAATAQSLNTLIQQTEKLAGAVKELSESVIG